MTFAYYGVPCLWELKVGYDKLSDDQRKLQTDLTTPANGWRHAVISSVPEAKAFLDAIHPSDS